MTLARYLPSSLLATVALLAGCSREPITISTPALDGITVSGSGHVRAAPDVARVNLGVEVHAATADEASKRLAAQSGAVVAALKKAGVPDKDLRTSDLSLFRQMDQVEDPPAAPEAPTPKVATRPGAPVPVPPSPPPYVQPRMREVYRASNTVEVTVRNLDRIGEILSAATGAGANQVHGITFTIDDPKPFEGQARDKAMADARARADQLARIAGVELGPVLSIQDTGGGGFVPPMPVPMGAMRAEKGAGMGPVERGELDVTREVVVRYAIARK